MEHPKIISMVFQGCPRFRNLPHGNTLFFWGEHGEIMWNCRLWNFISGDFAMGYPEEFQPSSFSTANLWAETGSTARLKYWIFCALESEAISPMASAVEFGWFLAIVIFMGATCSETHHVFFSACDFIWKWRVIQNPRVDFLICPRNPRIDNRVPNLLNLAFLVNNWRSTTGFVTQEHQVTLVQAIDFLSPVYFFTDSGPEILSQFGEG